MSGQLSLLADARVIWGGDDSVKAIRSLDTKPRCRDISFADRYSATVINGDALTDEGNVKTLASLLWKDTQPYEQQACSSPRIIFWLGDSSTQASLFAQLNELAEQHASAIGTVNNHLVTSQLIQSRGEAGEVLLNQGICVMQVKELVGEYLDWHPGQGMYLLLQPNTLDALCQYCTDKLQTLSYWGLAPEQMLKLASNTSIKGIDRIVPVGQSLDFTPDWDGYRLLTELSRHITVG